MKGMGPSAAGKTGIASKNKGATVAPLNLHAQRPRRDEFAPFRARFGHKSLAGRHMIARRVARPLPHVHVLLAPAARILSCPGRADRYR